MDWAWLWAIVGFSLGIVAERFVLDRKFLRELRELHEAAQTLVNYVERERPRQSEPPGQPPH